jgi:hypothetical protein
VAQAGTTEPTGNGLMDPQPTTTPLPSGARQTTGITHVVHAPQRQNHNSSNTTAPRQPPPDPWASFRLPPRINTHEKSDPPGIQNSTETDIPGQQTTPFPAETIARNRNQTPTRQRWSEEETQALLSAIEKYGTARWTKIFEENKEIFKDRDPAKLKDRFRTLIRRPDYEHLADDYNQNKRKRTKK